MIAVNQASAPFASSRRDQGVNERQPLRHLAADIERRESHPFIDWNDLVQGRSVILRRTASLSGRSPKLAETARKFDQ